MRVRVGTILIFLVIEFIFCWHLFIGADQQAMEYEKHWKQHYATVRLMED